MVPHTWPTTTPLHGGARRGGTTTRGGFGGCVPEGCSQLRWRCDWTGTIVSSVDGPIAAITTTVASDAAPSMISMDGGDVITLPAPRTALASTRVGTSWRRVPAASGAGLPAIGVAAVLVSVKVSSASRTGTLALRPTGASSSGHGVVSYRSGSTSGLSLVKLGLSDSIDLRTTAGRPAVSVKVVGYVPETAPLVVPSPPRAPVTTDISRATKNVQLAGRGSVPASATALVVAVTTSRATVGRLASHLDTRDHRGDRRPRLPRR